VTNEAFARIKIDQLLKDTGWRLTDGLSVRYECPLNGGGRADYALFDRQGRGLAVLEAKSTSVSLSAGEAQGRRLTVYLHRRSGVDFGNATCHAFLQYLKYARADVLQ